MIKSDNRKLIISFIIVCLMIIASVCCYLYVDVNQLFRQLEQFPIILKVITMIFLITLQIILAFLPGEPLELASGYIFGDLLGTVICLIASLIGTSIVYFLVHNFRYRIIDVMFKKEKIVEVEQFFSTTRSQFWFFIIFLIPGTPKDILTYVASLGDLELSKWLLLTTLGRIPSVITSTYLSSSIKQGNYTVTIILFSITVILVMSGMLIYKYIIHRNKNKQRR